MYRKATRRGGNQRIDRDGGPNHFRPKIFSQRHHIAHYALGIQPHFRSPGISTDRGMFQPRRPSIWFGGVSTWPPLERTASPVSTLR
jgi:hypothetical protein